MDMDSPRRDAQEGGVDGGAEATQQTDEETRRRIVRSGFCGMTATVCTYLSTASLTCDYSHS